VQLRTPNAPMLKRTGRSTVSVSMQITLSGTPVFPSCGRGQMEVVDRLYRKLRRLPASGSGDACAGTSPEKAADESSLATSRNSSNDCPNTGSTADLLKIAVGVSVTPVPDGGVAQVIAAPFDVD